jgi:hypothetical protein
LKQNKTKYNKIKVERYLPERRGLLPQAGYCHVFNEVARCQSGGTMCPFVGVEGFVVAALELPHVPSSLAM